MAVVFFFGSALLLAIGFIVGVLTTPYYMSREDKAVEESRRMAEGIRNAIGQLTEVCHKINSHKGTPGVPVNNCYEMFNPIQDDIQRPIMNQLKSLLPDGRKDV